MPFEMPDHFTQHNSERVWKCIRPGCPHEVKFADEDYPSEDETDENKKGEAHWKKEHGTYIACSLAER